MRKVLLCMLLLCVMFPPSDQADASTGQRIQLSDWAAFVAQFPHSNRLITAPMNGAEENIHVWSMDGGKQIFSLPGTGYGSIISASISSVGQILTVHNINTGDYSGDVQSILHIWNGENGNEIRHVTLPLVAGRVMPSIDFSESRYCRERSKSLQ